MLDVREAESGFGLFGRWGALCLVQGQLGELLVWGGRWGVGWERGLLWLVMEGSLVGNLGLECFLEWGETVFENRGYGARVHVMLAYLV